MARILRQKFKFEFESKLQDVPMNSYSKWVYDDRNTRSEYFFLEALYSQVNDFTVNTENETKIISRPSQMKLSVINKKKWWFSGLICWRNTTNIRLLEWVVALILTNDAFELNDMPPLLLRVVQTQAILFLKSMSKKVGSNIEWLWVDLEIVHPIWTLYVGSDTFRQWF